MYLTCEDFVHQKKKLKLNFSNRELTIKDEVIHMMNTVQNFIGNPRLL